MSDDTSGNKSHDEDELWILELIDYNRTVPWRHISAWTSIFQHTRSRAFPPPQTLQHYAIDQAIPPSRSDAAWAKFLTDEILRLPRTNRCFQSIQSDPLLSYNLPKKGALAGQVLKHVFGVLDRHLERHRPSIYKIGYTRNPQWRFHNPKYGYIKNVERWEGMTIVFASENNIAPAYVEAAAIQKHLGTLPLLAKTWFSKTSTNYYLYLCCAMETSSQKLFKFLPNPGKEGCKNIRDGGETVTTGDGGPYMVYFVYRSFQRPSDAPLMLMRWRKIMRMGFPDCRFKRIISIDFFDIFFIARVTVKSPRLRKQIETEKNIVKKPLLTLIGSRFQNTNSRHILGNHRFIF